MDGKPDLFFEQGIRQLEMLMFVRAWVKQLSAPRADALHIGGIVHGKLSACIEFARVAIHVPTAGFINVEPDHLLTDRTRRHQRMKPPSPQELDELNDPYR
jgi:hypothetical protein